MVQEQQQSTMVQEQQQSTIVQASTHHVMQDKEAESSDSGRVFKMEV